MSDSPPNPGPANFHHWDSWVLISVIYASRETHSAALTDIVAAADYLNHAIVTRGELETAFARLVPAGHLSHTPDGFITSDAVNTFWQTTGSKMKKALDAWDAAAAFIGAPDWAPGPLPETTEERYVTTADYDAAVEAYLGRMSQRKKTKEE